MNSLHDRYKYVIIMTRMPFAVQDFACGGANYSNLRFEYGVILNGSQTEVRAFIQPIRFEYGVILNGSQTFGARRSLSCPFEYGVVLNGSQTYWGNHFPKQ